MTQQHMRGTLRLVILIFVAAVCAACLFLLCYQADNKYTWKAPRPQAGVLVLSEQELREYPLLYLTTGWEIYRDRLLSPEDFASGLNLPDEYVFIGQYGGLEGSTKDGVKRGPHGSATYRLNIALPAEVKSYTLELPEIYSAYRLYINGELIAGMGDPVRESYRAETGNSKITLRRSGRMEILVAVSDYSHFYSGMVYPPAFGETAAVESVLNTRFALRAAAVALSLGVGALYLGIWMLLRKDKSGTDCLPLYYAALCLCFAVVICYPVVKTLWTSGTGWYTLESLASAALPLLVGLIQSRISGFPGRWTSVFAVLGIFTCGWTLVAPFVMGDRFRLMMAHSAMLNIYSWIAALFLLVSAAYGVYKSSVYSKSMLVGAVAFGMSLVMDRLLPLFEPIRFGWFSEISGGIFVLSIGVVMAGAVAGQFRLRLLLESRVESVTRMVEVQKAYYPEILEKEEKLRAAQHDLRHHIAVVRALAAESDSPKLMEYAKSFGERVGVEAQEAYCMHYVADMMLRMYAGLARQQDTQFSVEAALPEALPVDDVDLCVILGNLLENALEASMRIPESDRYILVRIRCRMNHFGISVDNAFDGVIETHGGRFLSRKGSGREGVGLASVRSVCERYGGSAAFCAREDNVFHSEILLPLGGKEGETA